MKLYRKTLSGPYHTTPSTPPINHTQSKKHSKHIRKSKSPNILSTFSFKDISQESNINLTSPIIQSRTPTDVYKSFNYKPQKKNVQHQFIMYQKDHNYYHQVVQIMHHHYNQLMKKNLFKMLPINLQPFMMYVNI